MKVNEHNMYFGNAVHHNHSRCLEINIGGSSPEAVRAAIRAALGEEEEEEEAAWGEAEEEAAAPGGDRACAPHGTEAEGLEERLRRAIETLRTEKRIKYKYDLAWVMWAVNHSARRMLFRSSLSFLDYLKRCGVGELPSADTLQQKGGGFSLTCRIDDWSFADKPDERERKRRISVAKYALNLMK